MHNPTISHFSPCALPVVSFPLWPPRCDHPPCGLPIVADPLWPPRAKDGMTRWGIKWTNPTYPSFFGAFNLVRPLYREGFGVLSLWRRCQARGRRDIRSLLRLHPREPVRWGYREGRWYGNSWVYGGCLGVISHEYRLIMIYVMITYDNNK